MTNPQTLDVSRRSERIYAERLRQVLEPTHLHEYVAIEPDSGDFFLAPTLSEAVQAARAEHPDRLAFAMRVGHAAAIHLGVLAP